MEITRARMSGLTLFLVAIAAFIGQSEEIAVMSIDIGSEWMKVAIVSVREIHFISLLLVTILPLKKKN